MHRIGFWSILAFTLVACGFWTGNESQAQRASGPSASSSSSGVVTPQLPNIRPGDPLPANAFIELAKAVNPAVVNISTRILPRNPRGGTRNRDPFLDMLERFYGMPIQPQQQRPQNALGTGFVIRADGLIVTNNHVVRGADEIDVQFSTEKKLHRAKLVGSDDKTDVALLRVDLKNLPVLALGSSSETQVGEWVAAFGNPLGQGHTMTKGIISAKGRDLTDINRFPLLQTDTPINPGNSGGPLVNLRGQVIGVNSAIAAGAQGIGFAIPIDEVKAILPQLETLGRIRMGFVGIGLAEISPEDATALGLGEVEGAMVAQVQPGSPADRGGLRPYDVIVQINKRQIKSAADVSAEVASLPVESTADFKILREGKERTLKVKIGERPESADAGNRGGPGRPEVPRGVEAPKRLGFEVAAVNDALRREFNLSPSINGVVVLRVESRGVAANSGLLPGDLILDVNRQPVRAPSDLMSRLKSGAVNVLRIARQDDILFIRLQVP